jgi:8-oxoguanine deaminase
MSTILLSNIDTLATFNEERTRYSGGWILIRDNVIDSIGAKGSEPTGADKTLDLNGYVVMPGLINTHHHLFQSLLRNIPRLQDVSLFDWLHYMYLLMSEVYDEDQYLATMVNHAELLLSGCTTSVDHSYIKVNDMKFDTQIAAAKEMGIRFDLARGSFSIGQSEGGLPPDHIIEKEDDILADTERLIKTYHEYDRYAMTRITNAPCSPFSVSEALMKNSIAMARELKVNSHTHWAESPDDEKYVQEKYGMTSVELAEQWGWVGPDVWYAHGVMMTDSDVATVARTGTGVAHCPNSNMYTAAGACRVRDLLDAGANVGLAVDGSAANNASNMLDEVRNALMLSRVTYGPDSMSPTQALEIATIGGARVLNRDDIGSLEPGKAADIIGFDTRDKLHFAGGMHDALAGVVFCAPSQVDLTMVNGKIRVQDGKLVDVDVPELVTSLNKVAGSLVKRVEKRYNISLLEPVWRRGYPYDPRPELVR